MSEEPVNQEQKDIPTTAANEGQPVESEKLVGETGQSKSDEAVEVK